MKHDEYRQWMSLSLYGELGETEEEMLEAHLAECDECSREQAELERLMRVLDSELAEPPADLLEQARAQLRGALLAQGGTGIPARDSWLGRLKVPLALAASLLVGVAVGQWRGESPAPIGLVEQGARLANIRFLDDGATIGEVVVSFDAVRSVQLSAPASDPRIQSVLLAALREADNPGTRIRAVTAVQTRSRLADPELRSVLLDTLRFDDNAGVRRRALGVLQEMPRDAQIRRALIEVLIHDENPGMRVAAVNALQTDALGGEPVDEETLRRLEHRLITEENDFVRLRSEAWLEEVRFQ